MAGNGKVGAVMVLGGGIGGMQAALDLAESNFKVYLVERGPAIGGVMAMLDKTFPTNDCAMCTMAPRLVEVGRHHNVELLTNTELVSVAGDAGRYSVRLRKRSRYVDESKCTGCGLCAENCPVQVSDEFNGGFDVRSAVYLLYPQAIPRVYTIDKENCLGCGLCANVCGNDAVSYELADEEREIEVGAIVAVPGFELFDANVQPEYGYGRYRNVITSLEFERLLSPSGPYRGMVLSPYDGRVPRTIAFIQCMGSRENGRDYCSSVCCMYSTKQALIAMEHTSGLKCTIFYIDVRAFGKGFDGYYSRAKEEGVRYIRCRPSSVKEDPLTKRLKIRYFANGEQVLEEFDMVVLSCGLLPSRGVRELAGTLGLQVNEHGFCKTSEFAPLRAGRDGIYVCGPFVEPKDIPETVVGASGAAAEAMALLAEQRGALVTHKTYPKEKEVKGEEPRIGVFVCHCGTNIGGVVDVPEVTEYARTLPNVVYAEENLYSCSTDTQERIKGAIEEHGLNRVVVASCTPRTHEPLFQNTIREAGLNPYLFEQANIRDQCSWVHMNRPEQATQKAKALVRMAVAKAMLLEPLKKETKRVCDKALVIGGGLSGMTAALRLAQQGYETYIVEKESSLGGNMTRVRFLLNGDDPQRQMADLRRRICENGRIHVYLDSEVTSVLGTVGAFKSVIKTVGGELELEHGAIVVATGAEPYVPCEYMYGTDGRVMTQLELEERLAEGSFKADTVVMIQCVGSRTEERPYCSRICCTQAVKNALRIKELSQDTQVYVIYRDIRTYGFRESYYTRAREAGVIFINRPDDRAPAVAPANGSLQVEVLDTLTGDELTLKADAVVLSTGVAPRASNETLSKMLKVSLNEEGFFLEAHMKLRPVDFATEGVYLCGMAHYPKFADEAIAQACAAAARASTILAQHELELEPIVSEPIDENCDGCAYCVDPCPFNAITLLEYMWEGSVKKTVQVDTAVCKGCGTCQATCPKQAIFVKHFRLDMLNAMVNAALEE